MYESLFHIAVLVVCRIVFSLYLLSTEYAHINREIINLKVAMYLSASRRTLVAAQVVGQLKSRRVINDEFIPERFRC